MLTAHKAKLNPSRPPAPPSRNVELVKKKKNVFNNRSRVVDIDGIGPQVGNTCASPTGPKPYVTRITAHSRGGSSAGCGPNIHAANRQVELVSTSTSLYSYSYIHESHCLA